jgi:5'-nucleotidase
MMSSWKNRASVGAVALVAVVAAACGSSSTSASTTTSTQGTATQKTLTIMVTNDDGVGAPGIDAVVQGLRSLPHTKVTVVAPLTNQSGTGGKTTSGTLAATAAKTASGYPATAVAGYPADSVIWAVSDHGLSFRPDLVVSGINFGQNIGPVAALSGTVGAAREAVTLGIPAIATSQGIDNGKSPEFSEAVPLVNNWVTEHRSVLIDHSYGATPLQANLNVPTCPGGPARGPATTVMAATGDAAATTTVDCTSTSTSFTNDLEAFVIGYATLTPLYPPAS